MPNEEDVLYGKVVLQKGFCAKEQIEECLLAQTYENDPPSLGDLLLFRGHITSDQHTEVLKEIVDSQNAEELIRRVPKEAALFGKLVVWEKLVTNEALNECLQDLLEPGEKRSLGEIMVAKGHLTQEQVNTLLAKDKKKTMGCAPCGLTFMVHSLSEATKVECPRCKGPLTEVKLLEPVKTDAEFNTKIMKSIKAGVPSQSKEESRILKPTGKTIKVACVICDTEFDAVLDTTGRARCPTCNGTFRPRGM